MVYRFRFYNLPVIISLFFGLFFGINFLLFADSGQNSGHGWGIIDQVRVNCGEVLFYRKPLGLNASLPEGTTIIIKALKTGFGQYYTVEKNTDGTWAVKASDKSGKKAESQFLVSYVGNNVVLTSVVADGFALASTLPTFSVSLVDEKTVQNDAAKANIILWELVQDPNAGDTIESCFLRNKATGGMLTASYDTSVGGVQGQIDSLKNQINNLETKIPYFDLMEVRTEGCHPPSFDGDLSEDITDKAKACIHPDANGINSVLDIPAGDWVSEMSGIDRSRMKAARFFTSIGSMNDPRSVRIQFKEGDGVVQQKIFSQIEGSALHFQADVTKHPAWPLKQQLQALQLKTVGTSALALKISEIAITGFSGDAFNDATNQWSKISIEKVVDLGGDDDAGATKETIAAGSSRTFTDPILYAHDRPEFKGSGELDIPDFVSGTVVSVTSQAIAWLSESLTTPGRGTISFRAMADQSDITVCLSDSISQFPVYRIVYGAAANTKTIIYKNDIPVQEISNEQNENAHIAPGVLQTFWVSLNNGFIIVGTGDPGSIILMAWQDPAPAQGIERVGLGAGKTKVKYTDVEKLDVPIITVAPQIAYVKDSNPIQVGTDKAPAWYNLPLSPADAGTIVFQATGSESANLVLSDDQGEGYIISFGADGNTCTKIIDLKGGGELYGVYSTISAMTRPTEISASLPTSVQPVATAVYEPLNCYKLA